MLAYVFAIVTAFFWAISQVIGKMALRYLSPLTFNTIRFAFAFVFTCLLLFLAFGIRTYQVYLLFIAFVTAALGWVVGNQLYYSAMRNAPAHIVITAGNSYPFWAMLIAAAVLGEGVGLTSPISAGFILGGSFLLLRVDPGKKAWTRGTAISLFVAFLWGVKAVLNKHAFILGMRPSDLLFYTLLSATIMFFLMLPLRQEKVKDEINRKSLALVLASGIFGFPVGELLYLFAMEVERVSALTPLISTTILFGFLLSIIMARERPTWRAVCGMVLIFAGVFLAAIS